MPKLLSGPSYVKLFEGAFNVTSICANESVSYDGQTLQGDSLFHAKHFSGS